MLAPVVLDMGIMTLVLQPKEVIQHGPTLIKRKLVDPRRERRVDVNALQSGDGVGANHGVGVGLERAADIGGGTASFFTELEAVGAGLLPEAVGVVRGRQTGEELTVGGGELVVGVVVGGPEGAAEERRVSSALC